MKINKEQVNKFFNAYEKRFNEVLSGKKPDIKGMVNSFSDYFVEAHPAGVIGSKNDKRVQSLIKKGNEKYKKIGTQSMRIRALKVTPVNDQHAMVRIRWRSVYKQKDKPSVTIDFDVFYFVQELKGKLKIFAYVTGDEQKALKDYGLI